MSALRSPVIPALVLLAAGAGLLSAQQSRMTGATALTNTVVYTAVLADAIGPAQQSARLRVMHTPFSFTEPARIMRRPPAPWRRQDPANRLYSAGREAFDDDEYARAARFFARIHIEYPRSTYAPDSYYWEAFSLVRLGGELNLRQAVSLLETQQTVHPRARTATDGRTLATSARGSLARMGDKENIQYLAQLLENAGACSTVGTGVKVAALNAMLHVNPELTYYSLRDIFSRTEPCGASLRQQSVIILSQLQTSQATELLLDLAQNSTETETRAQAVHWLAQVADPRAVVLLRNILNGNSARRVKENALFALSQQATPADVPLFQRVAERPYESTDLRVEAIDWLADQRVAGLSDWLSRLYRAERGDQMRKAIVGAIADQRSSSDRDWLMDVARDSTASMEVRKVAVSAVARLVAQSSELYSLYTSVESTRLREQIIQILARYSEKDAVEKLIDIAMLETDAALRGTTFHVLRQSKDPRAVAFISAYREK